MAKYSITVPIAQAISTMEGFTRPGTLAVVNNNPGNIRTWAGVGRDVLNRGYVVFPSVAAGWTALYKLVDDYIDGRYHGGRSPNLVEMFRTYAPAADSNDPDHYARFVASRTGLSLTTPLAVQAGVQSGGGGGSTSVPVPTLPPDPGHLPLPSSSGTVDATLTPENTTGAEEDITPYVLGAAFVVLLVWVFY